MFQFTWPLCTPPMFKFGPRGFQNWFYIHCSSNQKKVPSAQTFFAPNRSKLGKWTIQNHCDCEVRSQSQTYPPKKDSYH